MKICFKCGIEKRLEEFYKHSGMADGRLGKCIKCTKNDVAKREQRLRLNKDWLEKERERGREKYYKFGNKNPSKESKSNNMRKYRTKYPEKVLAKSASSNVKRLNEHKHHWSYNQEHYTDVIHITRKDHMFLHRFMVYDQEFKMYRDMNGNLLNSKESHINLLNKLKNA